MSNRIDFNPKYVAFFTSHREVVTPRIARTIARMVVVSLIAFVLFLAFTPWVQTSYGAGSITTFHPNDRPQSVSAMVGGRINRWFVHEGSLVKKGDPLVEVIDNDPKLY